MSLLINFGKVKNMNSLLLMLPLLLGIALPASSVPLKADSGVSTVSSELKKNFKIDTATYTSDDFVSFGCLWDKTGSQLKYYCYYPADYFNTCDAGLVNTLNSLMSNSNVVFDRDFSTSVYSLCLSDSITYYSSSGYLDTFSDYKLVSPSNDGHFYSYVVDGFTDYHSKSLNRFCVNALKYDVSYAYHTNYSLPGVVNVAFDSSKDLDLSTRLCKFDTNCETQFIDDGTTMKLVGNYDESNVITSKGVGFYSKSIDSFDSGTSGGRMLQNYFCAFNTSLSIENLSKVQLCYHTKKMYGKTNIQINNADSSINADWSKYLSGFNGSSSFDNVDVGSGSDSYHNVTVSKGTKTYKQQTSIWGELFNFGSVTYSYDTITKPSSDSSITGSASKYDWCFRFLQNKYLVNLGRFSKDTNALNMYSSGNGFVYIEDGDEGSVTYDGNVYDNSCFIDVSGVQILKLWDNKSTGLVEYNMQDKPSDTSVAEDDSDDHSGDTGKNNYSFWDAFVDWLTGNMPTSIILCVLALFLLPVVITLLPYIIKLLVFVLKYVGLGLWWLVKAPFILIKSIVSSIGGGK